MSDLLQAERAATAAMRALYPGPASTPRGAGTPRGFIEACWAEIQRRATAARNDPDRMLAILAEAERVMRAIGCLDERHWNALGALERNGAAGIGGEQIEARTAYAAAIASSDTLATFQAEAEEAAEARAQAAAVTARLDAEQAASEAPSRLLAGLRERGLAIALSVDGKHLLMPPSDAAAMVRNEGADLRRHKAALVVLLKAEATANAPVVVA